MVLTLPCIIPSAVPQPAGLRFGRLGDVSGPACSGELPGGAAPRCAQEEAPELYSNMQEKNPNQMFYVRFASLNLSHKLLMKQKSGCCHQTPNFLCASPLQPSALTVND